MKREDRDWSKFLYITDSFSRVEDFFSLTAAVQHGIAQGKAFSIQRPSGRVEATWEPGRGVRFYPDTDT